VMAHETAHVCAHHAVRQIDAHELCAFRAVPLILIVVGRVTECMKRRAERAGRIMKFSREFEAQADYLGVQYMYRAGTIRRLHHVLREDSGSGKTQARRGAKLSPTSSDPRRILRTQERCPHPAPRDEYT